MPLFMVLLWAIQIIARPASADALQIPRVVIGSDKPGITSLAFLSDPDRKLDLDQAVARFQAGDFELRTQSMLDNYGFSQGQLWFAFFVNNPTGRGGDTMLEIKENSLNEVRLYINRASYSPGITWSLERNGVVVPVSQREIPVVPLVFNAALPPASESLFVVRIDNQGPNRLHFDLDTGARLMGKILKSSIFLMACFGALFVLVLYNILLLIFIRDRVFLWFTLQLLVMGLYLAAVSGYGYGFFWPGMVAFQEVATPLFACIMVITVVQFMRRFLETRLISVVLDRLLLAHLIAAVLVVPVLLLNYCLGWWIGGALGLSALLLMLWTGGLAIARGNHQSLLFIIGLGLLATGAILNQLATFNFIPGGWPLWLASKGDYAGIMLQAGLFSFALSSRVTTLRAQRDSAEARGRFKQQFIATISHEMRTPLNAIIGFAESTLTMDKLKPIKDANRLILGESERLLFQINQVLDLAKLEAGRIMVESQPFGLGESLDYLRSVFAEPARRRGLELVFRTEGRLPPGLLGDRLRIEQVLRNLLDNALKFTEKGRVSLAVVCWPAESGLVRINYTVSDTGIGIAEDKQQEIFEDFVQADPSITRRYGGTGLGISIARRLVEAMGGKLDLQSRRGIGTSFSFTLWLPACELAKSERPALMESAPDPVQELPTVEPPVSEKRWRVLVVDDFEMNRQVVGVHLARLPVDLDQAESGENALALLATQKYDLVLLDLFMPGLSGIQVVQKIREHHCKDALPVLGLTASNDQADLDAALGAGMNGIMVKPFKKSELVLRMRELLPGLE